MRTWLSGVLNFARVVMQPLIEARAYGDSRVHERELSGIRTAWHYVGLRRDLTAHGDWIVARVVDREVVVQNFAGELRAFTNTCTHRFNALRTGERGNGPLTCSYHRWTFDDDGVPVGIPFRDRYRTLEVHNLRLQRWTLDTCGELVFVCLEDRPAPLVDWLGAFGPRLSELGAALGPCYGTFTLDVRANWKLVVQNTLEFDHVYSVHPETFGAVTGPRPNLRRLTGPLPHIGYRAELRPAEAKRALEKKVAALLSRGALGSFDEHEHISLFPLTAFGVFRGQSLSILRYVPLGPALTSIETRLFLPAIHDLTASDQVLLDAYSTFMLDFAKKLGEEDLAICESVQRGASSFPEARGILSESEHVVFGFQQGYAAFMAQAALSPASTEATGQPDLAGLAPCAKPCVAPQR